MWRVWYASLALVLAQSAMAADLSVKVTGIAAKPGEIIVRVFKTSDGFPSDPAKAAAEARQTVTGRLASLSLTGIEPGQVAVVVIHDENGDGLMEKTLLGLPEEGYGLSNNPRPLLVPRFRDALFEVKDGRNEIGIELVYY